MKARLFINRAMDSNRDFEEQAFWASASLELLGKAALVKIEPTLIANPQDDGLSMLVASGAIDYSGQFSAVQAKAIWSRCARIFRAFNEAEAKKIAAGRNEYIHSTGLGFDAIPMSQWWSRFWAQAFVLIEHLDQSVASFVGDSRREDVEAHLAANREYVTRRLATLVERARSQLKRHQDGTLSAKAEADWELFRSIFHTEYTQSRDCPSCGNLGAVGGDEVIDRVISYEADEYEDYYRELRKATLEIAPTQFSCPICHLVLEEPELMDEAGLSDSFRIDDDSEGVYEPDEYMNE